jgi:hypothetical protein
MIDEIKTGEVVVTEEKEIEVITPDKEPDMSMANLEHLEKVAEGIERFVIAQQKITNTLLKLAKPGDWVKFKSGEQEVGCLGSAGSERIAAAVGISFTNWEGKKEEGEDKSGKFYWWWHKCIARFAGREVPVEGRAGSRDVFFGKEKGEWKQLQDINEGNVRTASMRNTRKEGVRVLLGIRNLPIDELENAGIKLSSGGVNFAKKEATPEDVAKQKELGEVILKYCGSMEKCASTLETLTTWTDSSGKIVKGKKTCSDVTGKQLVICLSKAKQLLADKEKAGKNV